ncbi:hypothetical protein T492DRAFT_1148697, partial [Pavlovales sp. CCMP2436]
IYERREKWAYRYTWSYFTADANSSQVGVDQTLLLVDLIKYVEKYEEIEEIRNELKATRIAVKHYCNTTSKLPIVQKLIQDGTITPYAVERVKAQAVLSLTYQVPGPSSLPIQPSLNRDDLHYLFKLIRRTSPSSATTQAIDATS